jgi:hypothetical protein
MGAPYLSIQGEGGVMNGHGLQVIIKPSCPILLVIAPDFARRLELLREPFREDVRAETLRSDVVSLESSLAAAIAELIS